MHNFNSLSFRRLLELDSASSVLSTDLSDDLKWSVVIDPISNPLNNVYCMWPERCYVLLGDKIRSISQPTDALLHEFAEEKIKEILQNRGHTRSTVFTV